MIAARAYVPQGDYVANELPVAMRAFFLAPATRAVISQFGGALNWVDIVRTYEDGTTECWSNVPMHDGRSPPWNTLHRDTDATVETLLALAAGSQGKALADHRHLDFPTCFAHEYDRDMAWRSENS